MENEKTAKILAGKSLAELLSIEKLPPPLQDHVNVNGLLAERAGISEEEIKDLAPKGSKMVGALVEKIKVAVEIKQELLAASQNLEKKVDALTNLTLIKAQQENPNKNTPIAAETAPRDPSKCKGPC